MAEYRKQIAYLDYLEDGVKIKNAGFVRIEEQNGHNRMEVKLKPSGQGLRGVSVTGRT